jgi:Zn-dependent protease with chaperone function
MVLGVWRSLPAEDRAALAGVEFVEDDTLPPGRLADAGDRLVRLRAGLERHPSAKAIIAHELAHIAEGHDTLARARPHLAPILEQAADARAAQWGYQVPR